MKILARKKLTGALLGVCCYVAVQAQPCPAINLGTKTLYTAPTAKPTPPPAGYEPVFINHVGRHGARHLTKPVSTSFAYTLLRKADSANALTDEGKKLLTLLKKLEGVEKGNIKNISVEGVQEQQAIAKRMYAQNETLFRQPIRYWEATVTKEIRTRQTATAFVEMMQQQIGKKDSIRYVVNDTTLRFFDLSPAYLKFEESGTWKKKLQQLKGALQFNTLMQQTTGSWLTQRFTQTVSAADQEKLVVDVYGFYTILSSIQAEATDRSIDINADSIARFFTCTALKKLSQTDAAEDYLSKGPGTNAAGIPVKIAAPLLADFINTTDAFIQNADAPLTLRFCHAETIAPFAALLSLAGADKAVQTVNTFSPAVWNAATVVPLSANIQWILYKKPASNSYLLKCLLNERETKIDGLATKQFPYYDWQSVRAFYLKKLLRLKLSISDNGYRYLQNLQ